MTPTTPSPISDQASGELLPCAFCGGKAIITGKQVGCGNEWCSIDAAFVKADTLARSIECWNTRKAVPTSVTLRPDFDDLQTQVDVLTALRDGDALGINALKKERDELFNRSALAASSDREFHEAAVKLVSDMVDVMIANQCWGESLSLCDRVNALLRSTAPTTGSAPEENVWRQMLQENFERQEAGFERCYEALGITDDRERSWSALVIALKDAATASPAVSVLSDEQIRAIWFKYGYAKYAQTPIDCIREILAASMGSRPVAGALTDAQILEICARLELKASMYSDVQNENTLRFARAILSAATGGDRT